MRENNLIIWSGGFDSTALLLSKFDQSADKKYTVLSFYCDTAANCDEDRKGRDRIKNALFDHKNYNNFTFRETELKGCTGGIQGTVWPGLTLDGVHMDDGVETNVYFGYIRGDDFWHYRSHIEEIYVCLSKILNTKITPVFPFEWNYKRDLIHLYSTHQYVFDVISWAGDTDTVKLKEKDELQTMLEQIRLSINKHNNNNYGCVKQTIDVIETKEQTDNQMEFSLTFNEISDIKK